MFVFTDAPNSIGTIEKAMPNLPVQSRCPLCRLFRHVRSSRREKRGIFLYFLIPLPSHRTKRLSCIKGDKTRKSDKQLLGAFLPEYRSRKQYGGQASLQILPEEELHQHQVEDQQGSAHQHDLTLLRSGQNQVGDNAGNDDEQHQAHDDTREARFRGLHCLFSCQEGLLIRARADGAYSHGHEVPAPIPFRHRGGRLRLL